MLFSKEIYCKRQVSIFNVPYGSPKRMNTRPKSYEHTAKTVSLYDSNYLCILFRKKIFFEWVNLSRDLK